MTEDWSLSVSPVPEFRHVRQSQADPLRCVPHHRRCSADCPLRGEPPRSPSTCAPAEHVAGESDGRHRWYEVEVTSAVSTRSRGNSPRSPAASSRWAEKRDFWGFNRAKHAVLEATILATRLHLLALTRSIASSPTCHDRREDRRPTGARGVRPRPGFVAQQTTTRETGSAGGPARGLPAIRSTRSGLSRSCSGRRTSRTGSPRGQAEVTDFRVVVSKQKVIVALVHEPLG